MSKQSSRINLPLILIVLIAIVFGWIIYSQSAGRIANLSRASVIQHVSKDLKISLSYPSNWYVDDRYQSILLSDYKTSQNRNDNPSVNQIEVYLSEFSAGCHSSIEENLKDPACGEGGPTVQANQIITKESRAVQGGTFYKYVIQSPSNNESTYYLIEHGDRVLQISKEPDPSQHEEEFEDIINSIKFL